MRYCFGAGICRDVSFRIPILLATHRAHTHKFCPYLYLLDCGFIQGARTAYTDISGLYATTHDKRGAQRARRSALVSTEYARPLDSVALRLRLTRALFPTLYVQVPQTPVRPWRALQRRDHGMSTMYFLG